MSFYSGQKYSSNYLYNIRSTNPYLSQKILYRMNAQFYKRQSQRVDLNQYQIKQDKELLNLKRQNNPFYKTHLFKGSATFKQTNKSEIGYHWTDEQNRNNYIQPSMYRSQANILKQYQNIRIKQTQPCVYLQKQIKSNPDIVQQRFGFKTTFGQNQQLKFMSYTDPRRSPQQIKIKNVNNIQPKKIQRIVKSKQPIKIRDQVKQKQVKNKFHSFFQQTNTSPEKQSPQIQKQINEKIGTLSNNNLRKFQKKIAFGSKQFYLIKLSMQGH